MPPPTASPAPGFYLRAWYSQALPPTDTFSQLPSTTILDGTLIDGNVAVPAIYPGPLLILPFERSISAPGMERIVDAARQLGLLDGQTDFTGGGVAPGGALAKLQLVVDGAQHDLSGDATVFVDCSAPDECDVEPGTPEAFAALWQGVSFLDGWMPEELGAADQYQPERLALLLVPPRSGDCAALRAVCPQPNFADWPLDTSFADYGAPFAADADGRCAVAEGEELELLLPALGAANQLTAFVDGEDDARSVIPRVLVPGEDSPCQADGVED
jgi:hypothetical protein